MEYIYLPIVLFAGVCAYSMIIGYVVGFFMGAYVQRQRKTEQNNY